MADTSKTKIKIPDQSSKKPLDKEVHKVQILDPATGTGTFLAAVVKHIYKNNFASMQGAWSGYVEEHLIPRLNGFELLMASYSMAHLKMDMLLKDTGYKAKKDQRFNIYLTNSLEEYHPYTGTLFASWLSTEASKANYIKRDTPVMVVMGNPPYSVSSSNKSEWIEKLMKDYKKNLNEKNIQPLSDDYINLFVMVNILLIRQVKVFWTISVLKNHLRNYLFEKQGALPNNFKQIYKIKNDKEKVLKTFRDHYLLDFIRISDEESDDEKILENKIVKNIKKFIMSIGNDFAFIGNQYRIIVEEKEYYIDLLFFNRNIQSLVAFELKTGEFKPEYLGKMNFYLSALDDYVKQKHENHSIGIILCKEKNNKIVEFAFRDFNKAMGVATYKTGNKLPDKYKNILPDAETLKKLMD